MRKHLCVLIVGVCGGIPAQAFGQDAQAGSTRQTIIADERLPDAEITVTATGGPIDVDRTGEPVTVIGRGEIDAVQGEDLTRVLGRVPGTSFSRNGAPGSFTGVSVRGAQSEQLLVLVDGVRVADPAAPGGGFDFGNLLAGTVGKIDLLRSSNSTVWGSDAIGGVLAVSTRADTGLTGSAEYGARGTADGTLSGGIGGERGYLGGSASWYRTGGFSSAANGSEPDGFEQWAAHAQGRLQLSPDVSAFVRGRYAAGDLDLDGFPPPAFILADTAETQHTRQYSGAAGMAYGGGGRFSLSGTYSFADTKRSTFDTPAGPAPTFSSDGRSDRLDVGGEWRPAGPFLLNFGSDYERTSYVTSFDAPAHTHTVGGYAQLGFERGGLAAHVGARRDDHARFGGATSVGADVSYEVAPELRLGASAGQGFKAPTLFQLFSDFGNPGLRPERGTSFDLSLAWRDRNRLPYVTLALFRRDSEDLIDFVSCSNGTPGICTGRPFGTYDNVGRARAQGVELEAGAPLTRGVTVRLAYSYLDARDRTAGSSERGNRLARRPRHTLWLGGEWHVAAGAPTLGADLRWVSDSFDDAANLIRLRAYAVLDLTARCPVGSRVELYGRIENSWNERYQTAAGYASPPRGAFIGARWRL
jgi:vitamin B12 transporter